MTDVERMLASAASHSGLAGRRLSRRALLALAVAVALVTAGLFAVTPLQGRADYVVVAVLLYIGALTAVSAVVEGSRKARDRFVTSLVHGCFLLALLPLVALLGYVIGQGRHRFDLTFFTHTMRLVADSDTGGGAWHAIVGTLEQVGVATGLAVPIGVLVSIYTIEYGRGRFRSVVRYLVDVMAGLPAIVAGLFVLSIWVIGLHRGDTGLAGALALFVVELPVIVRSSEEILKLVPDSLREASLALGVARWRTILRVVVPTALPGMLTGIMLAVARVAGETAPILLVVGVTDNLNTNVFSGQQANLALYVFDNAGLPEQTAVNRAWTGALTLVLLVLLLSVIARLLARRFSRR